MKRLISVLFIIIFSLACFAEDLSPNDLFQEWAANGYPDYVSGVWSNDGSMNNFTFALVEGEEGERGKEEILSRLGEGSTVQFVYQKYSRNYLANVQDELLPYFEKEIGLISSGLDEMENRITLGILEGMEENPETLAMLDELKEKYGDVFFVEYGRQPMTLEMGYVDTLVAPLDNLTVQYRIDEQPANNGVQFFAFAITAVVLVTVVFAFYLSRKRVALRATSAGEIAETQMSIIEVETAVKEATIDTPPTLDERVMKNLK